MGKWSERDIPDLTGKRILVTGAASGIGYEAARAMASKGAHVILADRNEVAGREAVERIRALAPTASVVFLPLDLADLDAVRRFGEARVGEGRPLDVLVNNAGIQPIGERRVSKDGFELTFAIGHLGHFALTAALMPLLAAASAPRVVMVSSLVHGQGRLDWADLQMERGYAAQRAYNQTKLANLLFAREFQRRIDAVGGKIRSIAAHPGVARTAIGANRRQLGAFGIGDHVVSVVLSIVMPLLGQAAADGALPTLFAATAPEAARGGFYGPDGIGEMKGTPAPARVKPTGLDAEAGRRLWEETERLTGVRLVP